MSVYVDNNYLSRTAKRLEKKILKEKRKSLAWISMLHYLNDCVIVRMEDCLLIDDDKLKQIKLKIINGDIK